jgi:DNA-binding NtrC family response regulator
MPEGRSEDDDPSFYFGLTLVDAIHREFPELPIFILSSKPRHEVSLEFSRRGALGFVDRSAMDGPKLLEQALWNHGLLQDADEEVVGRSLPLLLALREARRAAGHRENVLIRGERGSGKELVARFLSRCAAALPDQARINGVRSETRPPLVTVNSAVFTPNLFSSELFGIEPRTASGVDGKIGLIEIADGGDLFLDEIADMPPEVQASMLRVLQDRQIMRVGGRKPKPVDVRFLSATNADVDDPESGLRADLLDRLRIGGTVWVPPLRDRKDDIPMLVEKFVREAEAMRPGVRRRDLSPDAMDALVDQDWPGNIRELKSVVFEAVNRHPDVEHLVPEHLREERQKAKGGKRKTTAESPTGSIDHEIGGLFEVIDGCEFPVSEVGKWAGRLNRLQRAHALLVARYLQSALEATKRRTPGNPDGMVQIHPAAKLATGNPSLTASKAADLFKRLLGPLRDELDGDLRVAYETSIRLRPRNAKISESG